MKQSTNSILLIRPSNFIFNTETAANNVFQKNIEDDNESISEKVKQEFENFKAQLIAKGIDVTVFDDTASPIKPDAIFPNNWVSFHADGTVILYPMFAANRRAERRLDIIDTLKNNFEVKKIIDFSFYENENKFLEGTGSIVFDHLHKMAYACLSPRTYKEIFIKLCNELDYKPIFFTACDEAGQAIYHTNVMMCIAEKIVVICAESIVDKNERAQVVQSLQNTGHLIIDISIAQMNNFAGNMLALQTNAGEPFLALSQTAYHCLTDKQKDTFEKYYKLLPLAIPTIETIGGGSVRCMMAEIFLQQKGTH
jgi:hypothetical protein